MIKSHAKKFENEMEISRTLVIRSTKFRHHTPANILSSTGSIASYNNDVHNINNNSFDVVIMRTYIHCQMSDPLYCNCCTFYKINYNWTRSCEDQHIDNLNQDFLPNREFCFRAAAMSSISSSLKNSHKVN